MRRVLILLMLLAPYLVQAQKSRCRIVTYNLGEGIRMDTTAGKTHFTAWMREQDPDVAALEEMNSYTQAQLEKLAAAYGHPYAVLLKEKGYPVALTSKYPIVGVERVLDNMHHGFLRARTGGYNIVVAHLSPFSYEKRLSEVATLLAAMENTGRKDRWVLLGDLNSYSPLDREGYADGRLLALNRRGEDPRVGGKYRNLIDGELDFMTQQTLLDAGLTDAFKYFHAEYVPTYPSPAKSAGNPDPVTCRLDYIYVSRDLRRKLRRAEVVRDGAAATLSDHLPLLIELQR